jgi:hypothetical protein
VDQSSHQFTDLVNRLSQESRMTDCLHSAREAGWSVSICYSKHPYWTCRVNNVKARRGTDQGRTRPRLQGVGVHTQQGKMLLTRREFITGAIWPHCNPRKEGRKEGSRKERLFSLSRQMKVTKFTAPDNPGISGKFYRRRMCWWRNNSATCMPLI